MKITSIDRDILRIAWPAIATNITVPLLGLVDVAIVGHIGDARYIGAIAIGTMMFNVIYWLFAFLRMGTSGLTAQAYGAGNVFGCRRLLREATITSVAVAAILLIVQRPVRSLAYLLFDPPATMIPLIDTYYDICVWGMPAMLSLYSLTGWLIGMQNTRATMATAISQNIINIVLSLVFVFALRMDIAGVALGTVLAQWAGAGIAALFAKREAARFTRTMRSVQAPEGAEASDEVADAASFEAQGVVYTYLFIFLRTLCLVAVNLAFVAYGASMGEQTLAVNTLLMQLFMLFSYVMDGFAYAGEALGGRYLGARQPLLLRRTVLRLFGWGTIVLLLFTIVYAFGGMHFISLLTDDVPVLTAARPFLPWVVAVPAAGMAAFVWDGIYIGTTRTRGMLAATAVAAACFFALWYIFSARWGNHALWLAFITFLVMRGAVQTALWKIKVCSIN